MNNKTQKLKELWDSYTALSKSESHKRLRDVARKLRFYIGEHKLNAEFFRLRYNQEPCCELVDFECIKNMETGRFSDGTWFCFNSAHRCKSCGSMTYMRQAEPYSSRTIITVDKFIPRAAAKSPEAAKRQEAEL